MAKILIVEDDWDIAEAVNLFLRHDGHDVLHIDDGARVMASVQRFMPDLVIMDIMLPNLDGIQCTQNIRQVCNVPIVMLTSLVAQVDKNNGLLAGADDYLCKPFDITELLLRVKTVLKRTSGQVFYDNWSIDENKLSVTFRGKTLFFSVIEFSLFSLLFKSPDRIYSRDQIIDLVYAEFRDITDRSVDSHVKNLRKKFKQAGIDPGHIQSVYGAGYRFSKERSVNKEPAL